MEKTNIPGLYKDPESGALVNADKPALIAYKKRKEMFRRIQNLEARIEALEKFIQKFIGEHDA